MKRTALSLLCIAVAAGCGGGPPATAKPAAHPSAARPGGLIVFDDGDNGVYTVRPDGSHRRRIAGPGHDLNRFSHDGALIAASDESGPRVTTALMRRNGSHLEAQRIPDPTLNLVCFAWTADDARLACEGWDDEHPQRTPGIFSIRARGWTSLRRLTRSPLGGHDIPGSFSPDGKRLTFVRENAKTETKAGFIARADGSHAHRITSWRSELSELSFAPGGNVLVFSGGRGYPETVRPDGTAHHRVKLDLDKDAYAYEPTFSPDGRWIVFAVNAAKDPGIYISRVDGTGARPVATADGAQFNNPDWGP